MISWLGHSRTHKPPTAPKWSPGSWYNNNLHVINISVFLFWTFWGTLSRLWARMSEPSPDPHQLSTQTWKNSSRIWPVPDPLRKKKKKSQKSRVRGKTMSLGWHSSSSWQQNLTLFLFQARAGTGPAEADTAGAQWTQQWEFTADAKLLGNVLLSSDHKIYCFSQASRSKHLVYPSSAEASEAVLLLLPLEESFGTVGSCCWPEAAKTYWQADWQGCWSTDWSWNLRAIRTRRCEEPARYRSSWLIWLGLRGWKHTRKVNFLDY